MAYYHVLYIEINYNTDDVLPIHLYKKCFYNFTVGVSFFPRKKAYFVTVLYFKTKELARKIRCLLEHVRKVQKGKNKTHDNVISHKLIKAKIIFKLNSR